eukprot:TRINITY_DN5781_c0_g1_i1.p1 TRINITY_DN5781_c0_g1~~TRINITY_DN5781_c0_g1_i1.p1  ORF type:complete len:194 (-),score=21.24 TRINITY_DN5781_c0_g1_i1:231-725(-)
MPEFRNRFTVRASCEEVRAFHQNDATKIFGALAPPGTPVTFQVPMRKMTEGAILQFTMWLGFCFPVRWTAVHSDVNPSGFVDTMSEGPVESWVHTHRFIAGTGDTGTTTTIVEDVIEYEYGRGVKGLMSRLMFNTLSLRVLFLWRSHATRKMLESGKLAKPLLD